MLSEEKRKRTETGLLPGTLPLARPCDVPQERKNINLERGNMSFEKQAIATRDAHSYG